MTFTTFDLGGHEQGKNILLGMDDRRSGSVS